MSTRARNDHINLEKAAKQFHKALASGSSANNPECVTSDLFLNAVFHTPLPDGEYIMVGYPIAPHDPSKGWRFERWEPGRAYASNALYYSPTTVRSDNRRSRRLSSKAQYRANTYAIVLDDIGTKISREKITLKPSYVLETSPGNFQYGYILASPVPVAEANAIVEGAKDAGLTDKGRSNGAAQMMRLPGSHNFKRTPPFIARIVS